MSEHDENEQVPVNEDPTMTANALKAMAHPLRWKILEMSGDRIKVAGDIFTYARFFFVDVDAMEYDEKAFQKRIRKPAEAVELLTKFRGRLEDTTAFEAADLDKLLHDFVEAEGIKIGQIIHALRVAITGQAIGPGMFDIMAFFGRAACVERIDRTLAKAAT